MGEGLRTDVRAITVNSEGGLSRRTPVEDVVDVNQPQ